MMSFVVNGNSTENKEYFNTLRWHIPALLLVCVVLYLFNILVFFNY
jgi:hypothetical protein